MFEQLDTKILHSPWAPYAGVMTISFWGGFVRFLESKESFSWRNLIAQLSSSSFAGMMTYLGCQYANINGPLTGVLCGVAAHMGTPAIIALAMKLKVVKNLLSENVSK
jgi:hypothetical protein